MLTDTRTPAARDHTSLTAAEESILRMEARMPGHGEAKDARIRAELATTPIRYYRALAALLDTERAVAFDPLLVARLRQRRDVDRRVRRVVR